LGKWKRKTREIKHCQQQIVQLSTPFGTPTRRRRHNDPNDIMKEDFFLLWDVVPVVKRPWSPPTCWRTWCMCWSFFNFFNYILYILKYQIAPQLTFTLDHVFQRTIKFYEFYYIYKIELILWIKTCLTFCLL